MEALREGVRRLVRQLENMQPDPYGKFTRIVSDLSKALEVGTEEEGNIYKDYLYSVSKVRSKGWNKGWNKGWSNGWSKGWSEATATHRLPCD